MENFQGRDCDVLLLANLLLFIRIVSHDKIWTSNVYTCPVQKTFRSIDHCGKERHVGGGR